MNNIKALCCNQYFELKKNGNYKDEHTTKGLVTKITIVSFMFLLLGVSFTLIQFDVFSEPYDKLIKNIFGYVGKKSSGKILAFIVFAVAYIAASIITRKSWYSRTIEEFQMFTEDEQKK